MAFRFLFVSIFILYVKFGTAQETIIYNKPVSAAKNLKSSSVFHAPSQLLSLPFIDDFAYPYSYPNQALWNDTHVYVNTGFGENTKTIGVATFDALNEYGEHYFDASTNPYIADYLTSHPINLFSYVPFYRSDRLYIHTGTYEALETNFFLYKNNEYSALEHGHRYTALDTIYEFNGIQYTALEDSIYSFENGIYSYIDGSYTHTPTPIEYIDSIALSFYFQSGGNGDLPEENDSLVLEFYVPANREGLFINEVAHTWIELYNATEQTAFIENYYLLPAPLDSIIVNDTLEKYKLNSHGIAPYSHTIIYTNEISISELSNAILYLISPDSIVVDSITSNAEISETIQYARIPDGATNWSVTTTATPNTCNPFWKHIWSTTNHTNSEFEHVYIPINSNEFHRKGFRFRFKNYASLSNDPSHARNQDFWNIDMVWLDANRYQSEPNIPDVAFVKPLSQLYKSFSSIPLNHFSYVPRNDFRMTLETAFENFDSESRQVSFNFSIKKTHTNETLQFPTNTWLIPGYTYAEEIDILSSFDVDFYDFIANDIGTYERGTYEFQHYYSDNENFIFEELRWNDTNRVQLHLDNYYAYDDGIPEAGYGLRNAQMGRVAYKYSMLTGDTLKAIDIYFNPTLYENATFFNLCVWNALDDGTPGDLVYYMPGEQVRHESTLYMPTTYKINQEGILTDDIGGIYLDGEYFIGWQQPYDVLLNVGLDLHSSIRRKLFFNLGYEWEESVQTGALMMRPVFGKLTSKQNSIENPLLYKNQVYVYPSIAKTIIHIQSSEEIISYKIFATNGQLVIEGAETHIPIEHLQPGFYIIQIHSKNRNVSTLSFVKK